MDSVGTVVVMQAIVWLMGTLVGLLLVLLVWGMWRRAPSRAALTWRHDDLLLGLAVLAAFALGVFLAYVLLPSF
jgi:hypothetical protein